jgi:hypothetical protein
MRVTSLDVVKGVSATYSAVLVEKETSNERCQLIGQGIIEQINDPIFKIESDGSGSEPWSHFQHRVISLELAGGHQFVFVGESRLGNEKPWWFADLEYHGINGAAIGSNDYIPDPNHVEQIDNLGTVGDRFQGRVLDIKHYSVGARTATLHWARGDNS